MAGAEEREWKGGELLFAGGSDFFAVRPRRAASQR